MDNGPGNLSSLFNTMNTTIKVEPPDSFGSAQNAADTSNIGDLLPKLEIPDFESALNVNGDLNFSPVGSGLDWGLGASRALQNLVSLSEDPFQGGLGTDHPRSTQNLVGVVPKVEVDDLMYGASGYPNSAPNSTSGIEMAGNLNMLTMESFLQNVTQTENSIPSVRGNSMQSIERSSCQPESSCAASCVPPQTNFSGHWPQIASAQGRAPAAPPSYNQSTADAFPSTSGNPCGLDTNLIVSERTGQQTTTSASGNPFHVDTSRIIAVPVTEQDSDLQQLGLTVFNQEQFEEGVMAQVDQALAREEEERAKKFREKEVKNIQLDIRTTKKELIHIEKVLQMLIPQTGKNREINRKLKAVKSQKDNKVKQLKKLKARHKALVNKLTGSTEAFLDGDSEPDQEAEEGPSLLEQTLRFGSNAARESEIERMIRLGEMTPFGTVVNTPEPAESASTPATLDGQRRSTSEAVPSASVSDFGQFLLDQGSAKTKHPTKVKRGHSDLYSLSKDAKTQGGSSNGKSDKHKKKSKNKGKKSHGAPLLGDDNQSSNDSTDPFIASQSGDLATVHAGGRNLFDSKDKRVYRVSEADFSRSAARRKKMRGPRLKHNFSEDTAMSDVEVGDEDGEDDYYNDAEYRPQDQMEEDSSDEAPRAKKTKGRKSRMENEDASYVPAAGSSEDEEQHLGHVATKRKIGKRKKHKESPPTRRFKDDGNANYFQKRMKQYHKDKLRDKQEKIDSREPDSDLESDMEFDGGFKVPGRLWNKLYRYQKTGVRWLWELHCQQAGGIIGDEMGLGKTIQTIAFLVGLHHSQLKDRGTNIRYRGLGPTIIVCPATVMHQWVDEFHTWWPSFRVAVLHSSGSYTSSQKELVRDIVRGRGVLVTSFSTVAIQQETLLLYDWHYVVLDEGHKIRNPDAQVTIACKQFRSCHRIILSGSPVQNNLKELWSLFDFVFPGKLGTLPDFMQHFSVPIVQGGYSSATDVQVKTAYKCACVLRDTISPYLLRRMKADVRSNLSLPNKNEQVLFCRITQHQRDVYQEYLDSRECSQILSGKFMVFPGLITLRKVCNHPDIATGGPKIFDPAMQGSSEEESMEYGFWQRSGKLIVVASLLPLWKRQGHRVLLFSQSRQMLDILERFVAEQGYRFVRMDGSTSIGARQPLINRFNNDPSLFVFLLTTRVGGVGVNLTGANRVVIFDPDWNPSTDTQARERAWRIGQTREVTIYRLICTGTIEEKIYHRQIFKQFLTNRVLKDPKQRRFFKANDLYELFTLGDDNPDTGTETQAIFAGTGSDVRVKVPRLSGQKSASGSNHKSGSGNKFDDLRRREKEVGIQEDKAQYSDAEGEADKKEEEERRAKMMELARKLSLQLGNKGATPSQQPAACGPETGHPGNSSLTEMASHKDAVETGTSKAGTSKESGQPSKDAQDKDEKNNSHKSKGRHKDKKKKKKSRKDAVFEGERISHLDSHDVLKTVKEEDNEEKQSDDYVLAKLLKKKGVHSALQHDTIMLSASPDFALVEAEADRVAKDAAQALKQSRSRCRGAAVGVPTWTGQSGAAGAPGPKPRFGQKKNPRLAGSAADKPKSKPEVPVKPAASASPAAPSSSSLFDGSVAGNMKTQGVCSRAGSTPNVLSSGDVLEKMKQRNYMTTSGSAAADGNDDDGFDDGNSQPNAEVDEDNIELITDIRNYVAFGSSVDGQATTQEILDQFASRVSAGEAPRFKAMIQQVCDFGRRDGIGVWRLKRDFR